MDRRVDLTENREFSGGHNGIARSEIDFTFLRNRGTRTDLGTYRRACRYMDLFGKDWHDDESSQVFRNGELKEIEGKCYRCGKTLIPWKTVGDLCLECNQSFLDKPAVFGSGRMRSSNEIFLLR